MWGIVNRIRGREWWRPLAPSLLEEDGGKYIVDTIPHQFMILMYKYRPEMCEAVPAVCHVDQTARPQTINKEGNKTWYELIKAFKDETGEGIVMNTSFNLAGEPTGRNTTRRHQELRTRRLQSPLPTGMANTEVITHIPLPLARLLFKLRS
jgi:predicted NodU family carbamoyl transferase